MKILYLHDIGSGANSRTPVELRKALPDLEIITPELPARPKEALRFLKDHYWFADDIDLVIGTCLGGFYALTFPMVRKLLINPALFADEDIRKGIGYGGEYIYEDRDMLYPNRPDHNLINETYALFGEGDELVQHYDDFCRLFLPEHAFRFSGEHRLSTEEIHDVLAPLVERIMKEASIPFACVMDEDFL